MPSSRLPPARLSLPSAAAGIVLSALALLAKDVLAEVGFETHYQLHFAAVAVAAVLVGPLAGLLATLILAVGNALLFLEPVGELAFGDAGDAVLALLFLLNGLLVSALSFTLVRHRRRAEVRAAALADSEARFRSVFESHPSALLLIDDRGVVRYANEEAAESFGYPPAELVGLRVERLVPENLRGAHVAHRQTYGDDPVARPMGRDLDLRGRRKDGTEFPVDVALRSYEEQGRRSTVAAVMDRSGQDEADLLRRQFIYVLSHELRTPVTTIYGATQMLLRKSATLDRDVARDLLEGVIEQSDRLHRIVENLLVVARVERGVELPGDEPVLLQRLLPGLVERERRLWPEIDLTLIVPADLSVVRADEASLSLLLDNLVSNAAKYGGPDGRVLIAVAGRDGFVEVQVADTGQGVDPADIPHLFDLFYRARQSARTTPGSGIGLYVSRVLAEAMGGTISIANRPEGGAVFTVRLREYEAGLDQPPEPPEPRVRTAGRSDEAEAHARVVTS